MPHRLELICQPAGTGKTQHCIQVFREALLGAKNPFENSCFFILPNKEHADRIIDLLLRKLPSGEKDSAGLIHPSILTIAEFIKRFARITTEKIPGEVLSKMILKSVLSQQELSYFKEAVTNPGFLDLVKDFISEAKSAFLTAADFETRAKPFLKESTALGRKFQDLIKLFKAYDEKLASWGLQDPDDLIRVFVNSTYNKVPDHALELVILDGFFHFTKAQLEFIKVISRSAKRVIATLTIGDPSERQHVFEYPEKTRLALWEMGFRQSSAVGVCNVRTASASLQFLEKNLFRPTPEVFESNDQAVQIFEAAGVKSEIEMIAREITKLYREGPYHYSDMGVLLRNLSSYEELIRSTFDHFGIPAAIHERKKLKQNPFIRAFMKWIKVIQNGWQREDLLTLLKSQYYGFPAEAVLEIENRSLEEEPFEGEGAWTGFCEKLAGPARRVLENLLAWHGGLLSKNSPESFKQALLRFVHEYRMIYQLAGDCGERKAQEDFLAFRALGRIMDEIALHHPSQEAVPLKVENYLTGLSETIEVGLFSIPTLEKNRVQVYDIPFALQKEYKIIFIAGLLEKAFPKTALEDALLKDEERELLNRKGPCFEERLSRISGERYFFYMAVTRAREKLYLTYPQYDLEGREALPSFYVEEVRECLPETPRRQKEIGDILPSLEEISRPDDLFKILTHELFQTGKESQPLKLYTALWNHCLEDPSYPSILSEVLRDEGKAQIKDPAILDWFKDQKGPYSVTRLQFFALCPFKFFASKILRLREGRETMEAAIRGTLLHRVLKEFYEETASEKKEEWILIKDKERAKEIVIQKLDKALELDQASFHGVKKYRKELMRGELAEILLHFLDYESEEEAHRRTRPLYFEKAFGRGEEEENALDFLRIPTEEGEEVKLEGRIDRIDYDPETQSAIVIDYKTGKTKAISLLDRLEKGIELQIPVYLIAASRLLGLRPAGGELYPLKAPQERKGLYDQELMGSIGKFSSRSALPRESFEGLLKKVLEWIPSYVSRIRKGEIAVSSKDCDYCPYDHVCRFEKWKLVYSEQEKLWKRPKP